MIIISHRGYWLSNEEKNTVPAFERSFSLGFGTETDIRDYDGELVISHDIPNETCISFSEFLQIYNAYPNRRNMTLALNIKSDGLQDKIIETLRAYNVTNYFLFDMSIPDLKVSIDKKLNVYTRLSEYEKDLPFYNDIKGIWLDAFISTWYDSSDISRHTDNGKTVAIVSSELHKRDQAQQWEELLKSNIAADDNIILCTDLPEKAKLFFKL